MWEFLTEVQKHFMGLAEEALTDSPPTTPNPLSPTGVLGMSASSSGLEPLLTNMGEYRGLPEQHLQPRKDRCHDQGRHFARSHHDARKAHHLAHGRPLHRKLVPFFHTVEELEALPSLHMLCTIMQTILLLNDSFCSSTSCKMMSSSALLACLSTTGVPSFESQLPRSFDTASSL